MVRQDDPFLDFLSADESVTPLTVIGIRVQGCTRKAGMLRIRERGHLVSGVGP